MMTKSFLFPVLMVLVISMISCSDDDGNSPADDSLIGTWKMTTLDYEGTSTTTSGGQSFTSEFEGEGYDFDASITFKENPNDYKANGTYKIDLETMVNGQTFTTTATVEGFIDDGTWEKNGNTLEVTNSSGDMSTATIITLNASTLLIEYEEATTTVDSSTGATSTVVVDGSYTFERE